VAIASYDHLVGFGEAMIRLATRVGESIERVPMLAVQVGGAELNGLIAATSHGMPGTWVSAIGDDIAGRRIVRHCESSGVAHALEVMQEARTGLYFVEMASFPRATRVFYDRSGSAASLLDVGTIDWSGLITPRTCLYSTGITAGISATARASLEEAVDHAVDVGATVALDINYRGQLWSTDEAYNWVRKMMPSLNTLSASDGDLEALGQSTEDLDAVRRDMGLDTLVVSSKQRKASSIFVTVRAVDTGGSYGASGEAFVVDPLGAGDAMFGALLALAPSAGLDIAVQTALNAALIAYGVHGDALSVDPAGALGERGIVR